ncbi:MAG: hypothetical protein LBQ08_00410, partial [Holosporaceae bacterium]|nr:hypothetical protein [Holosporaceae bacterium]
MSAEKNTKSCEYRSSLNSIIKRMILAVRTFIIFRGKSISRGAILVETALTLPIFCYLVFFLLELMKINETQTAVETITTESTFDFVYNKSIAKIDAIIEKHRPRFIPVDNIRYWIRMYESLDTMCSESPYGGEGIAYPDGECAITHSGLDLSENMEFIDIEKNNIFLLSTKNISNNTVKTY